MDAGRGSDHPRLEKDDRGVFFWEEKLSKALRK
jgi:hypothetical protein